MATTDQRLIAFQTEFRTELRYLTLWIPPASGHDDETPSSWLVSYDKYVAALEKYEPSRGEIIIVRHPDGLCSLRDDAHD